jgi:hypothetical protein
MQSSPDLTGWIALQGVDLEQVGSPVPTGDGATEVVTFRVKPSVDDASQPRFIRLQVTNN